MRFHELGALGGVEFEPARLRGDQYQLVPEGVMHLFSDAAAFGKYRGVGAHLSLGFCSVQLGPELRFQRSASGYECAYECGNNDGQRDHVEIRRQFGRAISGAVRVNDFTILEHVDERGDAGSNRHDTNDSGH